MQGLAQWLGCIGTKAALGYRTAVTPAAGRGKNICPDNSTGITHMALEAAGARLSREEIIIFKRSEKRKHC